MVALIRYFNDPGDYWYQLIPDRIQRGRESRRYPQNRFNCIVAAKRVMQLAEVTTPFEFPEGSMAELVRVAEPYARPLTRNPECPLTLGRIAYSSNALLFD